MKVLVSEDDNHIREGLLELLRDEGYDATGAADGETAWQMYQQIKPGFVLLDVMMPGTDGYTVCKRIRAQDELTPVVFISAKSEEIDRVLGLELGADDFIMKPFGKREVIARIRAITRRCLARENVTSDSFEMADLKVFPDRLRAVREGEEIDLSLRDISILKTLYKLRGRVVDRDTLFDECWGRDYLPSSRTLDQHISKLRKAVEKDPSNPQIISTVHGAGYRYDHE